MENEKVNKIISLIEWELDNNCDAEVYPRICDMKSNPRERDMVIKNVVSLISKNKGMTIDAAIASLESELE